MMRYLVGKDVHKERTRQVQHKTNDDPELVLAVYKQNFRIVHLFKKVIGSVQQDEQGFDADGDGVDPLHAGSADVNGQEYNKEQGKNKDVAFELGILDA